MWRVNVRPLTCIENKNRIFKFDFVFSLNKWPNAFYRYRGGGPKVDGFLQHSR